MTHAEHWQANYHFKEDRAKCCHNIVPTDTITNFLVLNSSKSSDFMHFDKHILDTRFDSESESTCGGLPSPKL